MTPIPFPLQHFCWFCYQLDSVSIPLSAKVDDLRGGGGYTRLRSAGGNSTNTGSKKCFWRDGNERGLAGGVFALDLDDIPVPCRDVVDIDDHVSIGVGIFWKSWGGYCGLVATFLGWLASAVPCFCVLFQSAGCD